MDLYLVGLDHSTAPIEIRERLAFSVADLPVALMSLTTGHEGQPPLLKEAVILSTCNRVEIYGVANDTATTHRMVRFLAEFHKFAEERFVHTLYFYNGEDVTRHLCTTSAGLRSLILGEAQIQGQVRTAYELSQRVGSIGPVLSRLFRHAIVAGKRARSDTNLGQGAASISQAGVELARQRLGGLEGRAVLLVGSGEVSELAAQNLIANGANHLMICNRTLEHAAALAERYNATPFALDEMPNLLSRADIVISSTAAPVTVIHREHIEDAMRAKRSHCNCRNNGFETAPEMLLIDLAVPRDIASDVVEIPGVHLATVDDLQNVVASTLEQRRSASIAAMRLVEEEIAAFSSWMNTQEALPTLSTLRQHAEEIRCAEFERAMRQLHSLSPEQRKVVDAMSRSLINKLLHTPTLRVKDAAAQGDGRRYAAMLSDLFDLETAL